MQNKTTTISTHPPTAVFLQANYAAYYCPMALDVYPAVAEEPIRQGSDYAADYQDEIYSILGRENTAHGGNLADYFWGSPSIAEKLTALDFSVCNLEGKLFGCFIADLTAPFTPAEDAEFRTWLTYQCTDGYGERLVQHPIQTHKGTAYLSFRSAEGEVQIVSAKEVAELLA